MLTRRRRSKLPSKRHTTLTLSADSFSQTERIARARKVKLSTVVAEALAEGLRLTTAAERGKKTLTSYHSPFAGVSDDEGAILDGVILKPISGTSSWLIPPRALSYLVRSWLHAYRSRPAVHISAITLLERTLGYGLLRQRAAGENRQAIDQARSVSI